MIYGEHVLSLWESGMLVVAAGQAGRVYLHEQPPTKPCTLHRKWAPLGRDITHGLLHVPAGGRSQIHVALGGRTGELCLDFSRQRLMCLFPLMILLCLLSL